VSQEVYREGFEEGLQFVIDLLEDLLYENEGEASISFDDVREILTEIQKTKHN